MKAKGNEKSIENGERQKNKDKTDPSRVSNSGRWIRSRRTLPLNYKNLWEKDDALYVSSMYPSPGRRWGQVQVCEYEICRIVASLYRGIGG
jgi:hypothetical protein